MTSHEPSTQKSDEAPPEEPAEEVVREMFARLSARDFDGVVDLLADDVEFDLAYAPAGYDYRESQRKVLAFDWSAVEVDGRDFATRG